MKWKLGREFNVLMKRTFCPDHSLLPLAFNKILKSIVLPSNPDR